MTDTSSYQSDQFFNNRNTGETIVRRDRGRLNDPFIYPDNTIRTSDINGFFRSRKLEKGYIRRINEFGFDSEDPVMCRFQFNPQYINQGAQFQSSIVNPIYQPIEQLQQPIASMTNFSFRLMFDRSMELNSPSSDALTRAATDNPWQAGGPSQVGVLHDIYALFRVIGQGISADDVEGAITRAAESLAAGDARIGKNELTADEESAYANAVTNSSRFFQNNANIGNTAFILPQPVRIVFSSLYIVEGFVTSTALEILKFSSAYVPMQAQVTLAVNAIYLGFAKKNTYFTHVLEQSAAERRNQLQAQRDNNANAIQSLKTYLSVFNYKLMPISTANPANRGILPYGTAGRPIDFKDLFFTTSAYNAFPSNVFGSLNNWTNKKEEEDVISNFFKSGELQSINFTWKASIFGPYTGSAIGNQRSQLVVADTFINIDKIKNAKYKFSQRNVVGPLSSAVTSEQWRDLSDGTKLTQDARSTNFRINLPNNLDRIEERPSVNQFYALLMEVEVEVKLSAVSSPVKIKAAQVKEFRSELAVSTAVAPLSGSILLDWGSVTSDLQDAVATSSTGTGSPTPGSTAPTSAYRPDDSSLAAFF